MYIYVYIYLSVYLSIYLSIYIYIYIYIYIAMRSLAEDRSIIIKPASNGSCAVVWNREDCLAEV